MILIGELQQVQQKSDRLLNNDPELWKMLEEGSIDRFNMGDLICFIPKDGFLTSFWCIIIWTAGEEKEYYRALTERGVYFVAHDTVERDYKIRRG